MCEIVACILIQCEHPIQHWFINKLDYTVNEGITERQCALASPVKVVGGVYSL